MKNVYLNLIGLTLLTANAWADTAVKPQYTTTEAATNTEYSSTSIYAKLYGQYQEVQHPAYYEDERYYSKVFVGIETPFISSDTVKISDDSSHRYEKTTTFNLNNNIFEGLSLLFGLDTGDTGRYSLQISHTHTDTDTTSTRLSEYSLRADIPITKNYTVVPFARVGAGYITAEADHEDISAMLFMLGLGATYNISQNVFTYGVLQYALVPETELGDTDLKYKEHEFTLSLGLGYRF